MNIEIRVLPHGEGLPLPKKMTIMSAGYDLYAAVEEPIIIESMTNALIPIGFEMALPLNYEAQIRPRSGLAKKHCVTVLNTPGTIDADYRGEVKVLLMNFGQRNFTVNRRDRIAQMIINRIGDAVFVPVDELTVTKRAGGGFGHSGI